jgi:syntaxin 5
MPAAMRDRTAEFQAAADRLRVQVRARPRHHTAAALTPSPTRSKAIILAWPCAHGLCVCLLCARLEAASPGLLLSSRRRSHARLCFCVFTTQLGEAAPSSGGPAAAWGGGVAGAGAVPGGLGKPAWQVAPPVASGAAPLLPAAGLPPGAGAQSEFSRRAARIGHGIHSTSAKLTRLAQLAKRTSVFDDPSAEINELTAVVKQDITALNAALNDLQAQAAAQRGLAAAAGGRGDSGEHSATVVDTLKTRLMGATREFRDVLTQRQEAIKVHQNRRGLFSALPEDGGASGGGASNALALRRPGVGSLQSSGPGGLPTFSRQGGQQMQLAAPQQDAYLASRAEALQQVERTIAELGGIFQQLATMVAEQGELAVRIDENLEDANANVDNAQAQLLRYLQRISSNRWLVMKIFAVLLAFLVFFVMFVA